MVIVGGVIQLIYPSLHLSSCRGHKEKIFVAKSNPFRMDKLVTVGVKHIRFWQHSGTIIISLSLIQQNRNNNTRDSGTFLHAVSGRHLGPDKRPYPAPRIG